tara:strand:- start:2983 stop:3210 length:228 start_codon:yes stop_codon:yes gene_type:complete
MSRWLPAGAELAATHHTDATSAALVERTVLRSITSKKANCNKVAWPLRADYSGGRSHGSIENLPLKNFSAETGKL